MAKSKRTGMYEVEWHTLSIRSIKIVLFGVSAIILFVIWWYWIRNAVTKMADTAIVIQESAARFIDYDGKVEVKPKDEFIWKGASFKMDLHEGDRIRTYPDSSAKIKFDDGTEITVQTDSIVVISRKSMKDINDSSPLAVVEVGGSDINAEHSASAPSLSTEKIRRAKFAPGSTGSVVVEETSGSHTATVQKGHGVITDSKGVSIQLAKLEQARIDNNFNVTKTKLPSTPPLLSPSVGQLFEFTSDEGLSLELKWRDVPDAVKYHIQISESPLFGKLSADSANLTKSAITIKIPKSHKKQFFWRVSSIDANKNRSPWSEPFQFVVFSPSENKPKESSDKVPPALKITYMHPFLPYVQVEGKTEADAFLTLNGQVIDVKEDGSFVYTYTLLQSGWNELKFIAEDPSGNKNTVTKRVEYR